ncbi:Zinc-uptake complex component A, substrate-binding [Lentibacillus halodurans]|uniref:Zinc-uptake complex component A, substrate-binding n=1 Tax=Lentibacillus halodurans TaxID=237679 RepID=A0A1I0WQP8_9BACI|nr:zinc ABC transporter substrate-binding protein [Lentibacillus halodurans]SFA90518.1 Zinc-uptake complex component A, substrate-binding [Lentibacillus halodurans]
MKFFKYCFAFLFVVLFTIGCSSSDRDTSENEGSDGDSIITVYTTIYPFQFTVEHIGGETVDAETIYPPGVDAHTYEPTSKEMSEIADGDSFIYLGSNMKVLQKVQLMHFHLKMFSY